MLPMNIQLPGLALAATTFLLAHVALADEGKPGAMIRAADFVTSSEGVARKNSHVALAAGRQWFSFEVEIPVTGRYRVEVSARAESDAPATLNVEDYIDNKDGRNYDITSAMVPSHGKEFTIVAKEGSPLQAGAHRMKLISNGGPVSVGSLIFTLIKAHENTPRKLVQKLEGGEWELVWSDEFETDGQPDPKTWAHDIGNWGWGNREPQYYTEGRLENARCEGGRLIIEARKDREDGGWSSARLTTRGRISFLYGKIEFRARTTAGDGNWAAIWMLGDDYRDEVSWPYCGEIDILENVGREIDDRTGDGRTHFSCHTRAYYFKQNNHISASREVPGLGNKFHDYVLEWTPKAVKIFFDGEHVYTYDKTASELEFPFNRPQNLIINMAMGGGMGGEIDPSLQRERMEVEYLRVYGRR